MEEMHVLLKNRGKINPRSSQEYADRGGFEALHLTLSPSYRLMRVLCPIVLPQALLMVT